MKSVPIVAVHDSLLGFKNINIVANVSVGIRGFTNSCRYLLRHENDDCVDVSDLSLYHVGDFDLETGDIIPITPCKIAAGLTVVSEEKLNLDKVEFVDDPYEV